MPVNKGRLLWSLGCRKRPDQTQRIKPAGVGNYADHSQTDNPAADSAGSLQQGEKAGGQVDLSSTEFLPPGPQQQGNSRIERQDVDRALTARSRIEQKNRDNPDNQIGKILLGPVLPTLV